MRLTCRAFAVPCEDFQVLRNAVDVDMCGKVSLCLIADRFWSERARKWARESIVAPETSEQLFARLLTIARTGSNTERVWSTAAVCKILRTNTTVARSFPQRYVVSVAACFAATDELLVETSMCIMLALMQPAAKLVKCDDGIAQITTCVWRDLVDWVSHGPTTVTNLATRVLCAAMPMWDTDDVECLLVILCMDDDVMRRATSDAAACNLIEVVRVAMRLSSAACGAANHNFVMTLCSAMMHRPACVRSATAVLSYVCSADSVVGVGDEVLSLMTIAFVDLLHRGYADAIHSIDVIFERVSAHDREVMRNVFVNAGGPSACAAIRTRDVALAASFASRK